MSIVKPIIVDVWGNANTSSPDMAVPPYIDSGFPAPGGIPVKPLRGYINWLFNYVVNAVRYYCSRGIPEWDVAETQYANGSVVLDGVGKYWVLFGSPTTGLAPHADQGNWVLTDLGARAIAGFEANEIWAWRNVKLQRRFAVDHFGFPNGNIIQWDEYWDDNALISVTTTGQTTGARWTFNTTGGGGGGGNFAEHHPQYTSSANNGMPMAGISSYTGGGRAEIIRSPYGQTGVFTDDITAEMFWTFLLPPTASAGCTFTMGFDAGNHHIDAVQDGAFIFKGPTDTNWQFLATSGGTGTLVDTGVPAGSGTLHRAAIVLVGANQSDDGVARAFLFIDGVQVGDITTHLPYTTGGAGAGLQLAPIFGINSTAGASAIELLIGPVRYRQSMFAGDLAPI